MAPQGLRAEQGQIITGLTSEVAVAQFIAEQGDDAILRGAFGLPDGVHISLGMPHDRLYFAHGPAIPGQLRVAGEEDDALADGLGQQQTVELNGRIWW